jgi:hypothetical protein
MIQAKPGLWHQLQQQLGIAAAAHLARHLNTPYRPVWRLCACRKGRKACCHAAAVLRAISMPGASQSLGDGVG